MAKKTPKSAIIAQEPEDIRTIYVFDKELADYVVADVLEEEIPAFLEGALLKLQESDPNITPERLSVFQVRFTDRVVFLNRFDKLLKIKDQEKKIREYIEDNKIEGDTEWADKQVIKADQAIKAQNEPEPTAPESIQPAQDTV